MKSQMLKMANVKSQKEFYKLFPTEEAFMKVHGKKFKKAFLGEKIKKAQAGDSQPYNQMDAGMNAMTTSQSAVQSAIGNISQGTPKKTTGQQIAGVVKDIPVLGGLVNSIVSLWSGDNARKERAGALSDLQLMASNSAPRQQNRKYNRPDLDANVSDINQLMPAEGTGSNLLGRDGIVLSKGGEIQNTFAPNTIYSNMGYEPLSESKRMKSYYHGGQVPQANFGSILSNILSSSGGSGGGSGGGGLVGSISGILGGIFGGKTTGETTTINPYQYSRPYFGDQNYVRAQDGALINTLKPKLPKWDPEGSDTDVSKIQTLPTYSPTPAPKSSINGFAKGVSSINNELSKYNTAQAAHNSASGFSSITGLDNAESQAGGNIGGTVGSVFGPIGSIVGQVVGTGLGAILKKKGGDKAMARVQGNNDQMAVTQAAKANQQYQQSFVRTGGNIRKNSSPDMEQSGELNTLWGGYAEPISENPYLGQTIKFKGFTPKEGSHDQVSKTIRNGQTGIGVQYGEGGDLQPYNEANVEVEKGETAVQIPDETGELSLNVAGNLLLTSHSANMLGDPDAKGKKVKKYVEIVSKDDNKQNKIIEKAMSQMEDLDPKTPYERIKWDSLKMMRMGAEKKQEINAKKIDNVFKLQQAINDTAEERGIDADALAKGTIKAMKGAKIPKAQYGEEISKQNQLKKIGLQDPMDVMYDKDKSNDIDTTGYRRFLKKYYPGSHYISDWNFINRQFVNFKEAQNDIRNGVNPTNDNNKSQIVADTKPTQEQIVGTNAAFLKASPEERVKMLQSMVDQKDVERTKTQETTGLLPSYRNIVKGQGKLDWSTPDQAGGIWKGERYKKEWIPKVDSLFSDRQKAERLVHNLENYKGQDFADVRAILAKEPTMEGKIKRAWDLAKDGKVGPYHQIVNQFADRNNDPSISRIEPRYPTSPELTIQKQPESPLNPEKPARQMPQLFNPVGNYLPPNKEELDPRQLTGEYYALATNQLEPVPAQQYHPNLRTPYELSLQDVLNENEAATRGAQRFMGYNPAAQSNLLAQQYGANAKVLGDQFRINQEFKDKIYGENTNILNDAQLKNLGILDQQYQRQSKALSNTKDTAREALSSISDKYLRNKLENDTNAVYQNLYNYRYDPNGHAWNMNGPAQWNMSGNGAADQSGFASMPEDAKAAYYYDWKEKEAKRAADKAAKATTVTRNGAILKAMKNL